MSHRSWIFIVNPISGKGKAEQIEVFAAKKLKSLGIDYQIIKTEYAGHAAELAHSFRDKADVVIAVGGDGTINETGGALLHCTRTALGIIPCGSGNGLARSLGVPLKMGAALQFLTQASVQTMDTGKMNDKIFLCLCGFGFDALIAHKFANAGSRGKSTYIKMVSRELFTYKPQNYTIKTTEETLHTEAFILSVANGQQFGNDIYINPLASMFDGRLNLTVIKPFGRGRIIPVLLKMRGKRTHQIRDFKQVVGNSFEIESPHNLAHIDGEPVFIAGPQRISVDPGSLKILCRTVQPRDKG